MKVFANKSKFVLVVSEDEAMDIYQYSAKGVQEQDGNGVHGATPRGRRLHKIHLKLNAALREFGSFDK